MTTNTLAGVILEPDGSYIHGIYIWYIAIDCINSDKFGNIGSVLKSLNLEQLYISTEYFVF